MRSKLQFFMYSYTRTHCGPSEQHPRRRTRLLCWMLVIILTSERNSDSPCWDLSSDSFLTAISLPSSNFPCATYNEWNIFIKVLHWYKKNKTPSSVFYSQTFCYMNFQITWFDSFDHLTRDNLSFACDNQSPTQNSLFFLSIVHFHMWYFTFFTLW